MTPAGPGDPRGLEWVTWNNFSPGIISQARFAYGAADNGAPVPFTGQPAAAQADGTYGCIALPNGGLGPMPGYNGVIDAPSEAFQSDVTDFWVSGAFVYGPVVGTDGGSGGDELVYCIDSVNSSNNRLQAICATQTGGLWNRVIHSRTGTSSDNPGEVYGFTAALTMTNASDPTGVATGTAGLAMTTAFIADAAAIGAYGYLAIYPDPSSPGTTAVPHDYSADLPGQPDGETGILFGHQGRIVIFQQNTYLWTPDASLAAPLDQIYYTDPANTVPGNGSGDSLAQDEVFVQEWPLGAGAWGSISAGELFVVKNRGGGYIVSGDLDSPTITFLAGITPTFGANYLAAPGLQGMVYASSNNGVWVWDGGNVSVKLSNQLNDDFFVVPTHLPTIGPPGSFQQWADLIITPNNYVFDTVTGGWWRLDDAAVPFSWFGLSSDADTLYCFPNRIPDDTETVAWKYSKSVPSTAWQWKSYPLERSLFRQIIVREVVIRAQGVGTLTVTLNGVNGTELGTSPATPVSIDSPDQPVYLRFDTGILAQDITLTLLAEGTDGGPAPVVYAISIANIETTPNSPT